MESSKSPPQKTKNDRMRVIGAIQIPPTNSTENTK